MESSQAVEENSRPAAARGILFLWVWGLTLWAVVVGGASLKAYASQAGPEVSAEVQARVDSLVSSFESGKTPEERLDAVRTLASMGPSAASAAPRVGVLIGSRKHNAVFAAQATLIAIGEPGIVPALRAHSGEGAYYARTTLKQIAADLHLAGVSTWWVVPYGFRYESFVVLCLGLLWFGNSGRSWSVKRPRVRFSRRVLQLFSGASIGVIVGAVYVLFSAWCVYFVPIANLTLLPAPLAALLSAQLLALIVSVGAASVDWEVPPAAPVRSFASAEGS